MEEKRKLRAKARRRNQILVLTTEGLIVAIMVIIGLVVVHMANEANVGTSGAGGETEGLGQAQTETDQDKDEAGQETTEQQLGQPVSEDDEDKAASLIYKEEGIWIVQRQRQQSPMNSERLLYSSVEDYAYTSTLKPEEDYEICIYNYENQSLEITLILDGIVTEMSEDTTDNSTDTQPEPVILSGIVRSGESRVIALDQGSSGTVYTSVYYCVEDRSETESEIETEAETETETDTNTDTNTNTDTEGQHEQGIFAYVSSPQGLLALCDDLQQQEMLAGTVSQNSPLPGSESESESEAQAGSRSNVLVHVSMAGQNGLAPYQEYVGLLPYYTEIKWTRNAPDIEEIARYANVCLYNGTPLAGNTICGGSGLGAISTITLDPALNGGLTAEVNFSIYGNTAVAVAPFAITDGQLKNFKPTVSLMIEQRSAHWENGTLPQTGATNASYTFTGTGVHQDGTLDMTQDTYCVVTDSDGNTRTYQLMVKRLAHNIPVVYINTQGNAAIASTYTYTAATFSMEADHIDGVDSIETVPMRIKGRGHSTWLKWPKKSFKLNFDEKQSVFGLNKDKDYVLISNYYDRTLTRNYLAFELAGVMDMDFVPVSNPVDVYLNGEYYGVYGLGEQVEVADGRVELVTDPGAADCGFLLEIGGTSDHGYFAAGLLKGVEIHYPENITDAQFNYIVDYVRKANDAIVAGSNYEDYIDVDSFIDWLIIEEYTYNWDAGFTRNVYMYKDAGGKLKFGPVWDFDLSMGSVGYDDWTYQSWATSMNGLIGETWTTHLLQDPAFMAKLKARWLEKRDQLADCVDEQLNEMLITLGPSWSENYWRWMGDVEGQNIAWEWQMEYEHSNDLSGLYGYLRSVFDYRMSFMNKCIVDGYVCPYKPYRDETQEAVSTEAVTQESTQNPKTTSTEEAQAGTE